jgi:nitric oxide reductase subunit B
MDLASGAVLTFALLAWATGVTFQTAPPQPNRFVASNGAGLITGDDTLAGKAA